MKNIILIILLLALTGCAFYTDDALWTNLDCDLQPNNVEDIYDWVLENIEYAKDGREYWQTPKETLARGKGDCEDRVHLMIGLYYDKLGRKSDKWSINTNFDSVYNHAVWVVNGRIIETGNYNGKPYVIHPFDLIKYQIGYYR